MSRTSTQPDFKQSLEALMREYTVPPAATARALSQHGRRSQGQAARLQTRTSSRRRLAGGQQWGRC
ncbi:MAG TPA: hypothetical protein VM689_17170 [Aliidongia sp.]|nr:hypothetical protein [Aliidongia sp.]